MKKLFLILAGSLFFVLTQCPEKLMGFTDANASKQLDWEKQFDAQLNA